MLRNIYLVTNGPSAAQLTAHQLSAARLTPFVGHGEIVNIFLTRTASALNATFHLGKQNKRHWNILNG